MFPLLCYLSYSNNGTDWIELISDLADYDIRIEVVRRQGRTLRLRQFDHLLGTVKQITVMIRPSFVFMHKEYFQAFHVAKQRRFKLKSSDDWIYVSLPGGLEPWEYIEGLKLLPYMTLQMTEIQ